MKPLKCLIVDDSLVTQKKLSFMLEQLGHHIAATANTGAEALELFRACRPDLVAMDITMPDMDGVEATQRIISEFHNAVIIMVTSHGQEQMVIKSLGAGARGYVLKPVKTEKLSEMIAKAFKASPIPRPSADALVAPT